MRNPIRIDKFLELVDMGNLLTNIWKLPLQDDSLRAMTSLLAVKKDDISEFWHNNPDLRFSQVLINMGFMPNYEGFWYYKEEPEILEEQGLTPETFLFWGQNYDKDMVLLPKTVYKVINELNTDHIEAILEGNNTRDPLYLKAFNNELNRRKGG